MRHHAVRRYGVTAFHFDFKFSPPVLWLIPFWIISSNPWQGLNLEQGLTGTIWEQRAPLAIDMLLKFRCQSWEEEFDSQDLTFDSLLTSITFPRKKTEVMMAD